MAQFDVHRVPDGTLVVDCQSDFLSDLPTRFVVPLYTPAQANWAFSRLNPQLEVDGRTYSLATQLGAAIVEDDLGRATASLAEQRYVILNAIDFLLSGI